MKNFKILTVATFSLMLLSGCSANLPNDPVPAPNGPLSAGATTSSLPTGAITSPSAPTAKGDTPVPQSTLLPGTVDNPEQRNQKLVPDPAVTDSPTVGTGGSGVIIDGARDSLGAGSKDDKQQAAESYIAFVNYVNQKDYKNACKYVKLAPSQGTDCLAAMDKVGISTRTYPMGLKIDRLDNGVITGDMATLNKLVFVYDGDKRLNNIYMFRPTDGSGKWKIPL